MDSISLEKHTVEKMVSLFCRSRHSRDEKCPSCAELVCYAHLRLERCPHGQEKPACSSCSASCYRPEMRKKISEVMRFSGPRLILHHPLLAAAHVKKKISIKRTKKRKSV